MNKQELIEKYVYMKRNLETWVCIPDILKDLKQLDEPQKITIPQVVADWIEWTKKDGLDLQDAMNLISGEENEKLLRWFYHENKQETFARAWLDGYEVEKEKRYLVKIIGITDYNSYLNYHKEENKWTIESSMDTDTIRTKHTRKELEKSGFGWVFNCPGIEVKEVEE